MLACFIYTTHPSGPIPPIVRPRSDENLAGIFVPDGEGKGDETASTYVGMNPSFITQND